MKSLSAFMYAPLRMLPASLIADCSSSPSSSRAARAGAASAPPARAPSAWGRRAACVRSGRRACASARRRPALRAPAICGGTSSSRDTLIVGTLIMIVSPIICDSAVAAWPAPMFATSRRASSCIGFRLNECRPCALPLKETAHVEDQRRDSVAEDRGPTEQREPVLHAVELLDDDLLLTDQLHPPPAPRAAPPPRRRRPVPGHASRRPRRSHAAAAVESAAALRPGSPALRVP